MDNRKAANEPPNRANSPQINVASTAGVARPASISALARDRPYSRFAAITTITKSTKLRAGKLVGCEDLSPPCTPRRYAASTKFRPREDEPSLARGSESRYRCRAVRLVVLERRDLRLIDRQCGGGRGLSQLTSGVTHP